MGGILGAALGESPVEVQARIEEAKKSAKDVTGLVRKKVKPIEAEGSGHNANETNSAATNGKRKAEGVEEEGDSSKKAKVEDVAEG